MLELIEQLNKEARMLNAQREQMIGKKEMAEKAYKDAVNEYYNMFGVEINANNINEEYARVETEVKNSIEKLKSDIISIKNGDYKKEAEIKNSEEIQEGIDKLKSDIVGVQIEKEETKTVSELSGEPLISSTVVEEPVVEKEIVKPNLDEGFDATKTGWGTTTNINILDGSEFKL